MALATILLQPQRFARPPSPPEVAIGEDFVRIGALIIEDLANDGPLAAAMTRAFEHMGATLRAQVAANLNAVVNRLRSRAQAAFDYVQRRAAQASGLDTAADPAAAALVFSTDLLNDLEALLDSLTLPGLRAHAQFVLDLLRNDVGLSDAFLRAQAFKLIADAIAELQQLVLTDPGQQQRRRQCISFLRRLNTFLQARLTIPNVTADQLALPLHDLLKSSGVANVLREARCALDGFKAAVTSALALGDALSFNAPAGGDVGAALAASVSGSHYAWYPSWLLADEDLPVLGMSDFVDPEEIVEHIVQRTGTVYVMLRARFTAAELAQLANAGNRVPEAERRLVLAKVNELIQGPLIYSETRFPDFQASNSLKELHRDAVAKQCTLLANRRFFEELFLNDTKTADGGFCRWLGRKTLGLLDWPNQQVYVTKDRRFIMCDDAPLLIGENLNWYDAPIFSAQHPGQTFWKFQHISPQVCEGFAQHLAWPVTLGKAIWHLANTVTDQPGHRIGSAFSVSMEFAEALDQLIFCKPISGYESIGDFGKWLSSGVIGPRAVALFLGSFQGIHTDASSGNIFRFWLTVIAGDVLRTASASTYLNLGRDLVLSTLTLVNFRGPGSGEFTLPASAAQNHTKRGPFGSLANALFMMALMSFYKREHYSIEILGESGKRGDVLVLWFVGGVIFSQFSAMSSSLITMVIAGANDPTEYGVASGVSAAYFLLGFFPFIYLLKEGKTDDGKFTTATGGAFNGYPDKSTSPYKLPWAKGDSLFCNQGNQGWWSHNDISGTSKQIYAYDFGHDHGQQIRAARAGVVLSFQENIDDDDDSDANEIIIMHTTLDAVHDNPRGTGAATTFTRYLHGKKNGVTEAFALRGVTPAAGVAVAQGDVIMLADDTGNSFHSHLHFDAVQDASGGVVTIGGTPAPSATGAGVPIVFNDVPGDGVAKSLTWYKSENG